jgi:hypothetical protein
MDKPAQWALVGAAWFLAVSVALFGFLAWQRLGHAQPSPAGGAVSYAAQGDGTAVCPVTGERLQVGPDTPTVTYLGHAYYFSTDKDAQGEDARTRFLMDPDGWIKRSGQQP